ncbi:nitrilase-related carbon-nitrogen hydrolase [Sodalis sp. RH21]|uniref:nitrilase-related carbon-nitrogen hydrolase n=1 Tax=unclassified Sodalis (in: enterobacteria) TaxID=2636512 RepID=UPI0039B50232
MKLGLAQITGAPESEDEMIGWVRVAMDALPAADLVVLPELALCGYDDPARIRRLALAQGEATLAKLAALAREKRQALAFGYAERGAAGLYNAMQVIDPLGRVLANYRKTHLWSGYETALFRPGDGLVSFGLAGLRFGMLICYDLDFPEAARAQAIGGLDCLLCISATTAGYDVVPRHVVPARAYENGCFVAFVNRGDTTGAFPCIGQSRLAGPDGGSITASANDGAAYLTGEIDVQKLRDWRRRHDYFADRRADLY